MCTKFGMFYLIKRLCSTLQFDMGKEKRTNFPLLQDSIASSSWEGDSLCFLETDMVFHVASPWLLLEGQNVLSKVIWPDTWQFWPDIDWWLAVIISPVLGVKVCTFADSAVEFCCSVNWDVQLSEFRYTEVLLYASPIHSGFCPGILRGG